MALPNIKGVLRDSEFYIHHPSPMAESLLYYPISCGLFYTNQNYDLGSATSSCIMLMYLLSGKGKLKTRLGEYEVHKNDLIVIDLSKPHNFRGICEMLWLRVDGAQTRKYYWAIRKNNPPIFKISSDSGIPLLMNSVFSEVKSAERPREGWMSSEIYGIFCILVDKAGQFSQAPTSKSKPLLDKAANYIKSHFTEKLSVADIASRLNLDQSHFSRDFKDYKGQSPYEFIMQTRMDYAKGLLKTTDKTAQAIAEESGFSSAPQFNSTFKKYNGCTPLEFRKSHF